MAALVTTPALAALAEQVKTDARQIMTEGATDGSVSVVGALPGYPSGNMTAAQFNASPATGDFVEALALATMKAQSQYTTPLLAANGTFVGSVAAGVFRFRWNNTHTNTGFTVSNPSTDYNVQIGTSGIYSISARIGMISSTNVFAEGWVMLEHWRSGVQVATYLLDQFIGTWQYAALGGDYVIPLQGGTDYICFSFYTSRAVTLGGGDRSRLYVQRIA